MPPTRTLPPAKAVKVRTITQLQDRPLIPNRRSEHTRKIRSELTLPLPEEVTEA